jgi:RND family efflux transporter MFP subunit
MNYVLKSIILLSLAALSSGCSPEFKEAESAQIRPVKLLEVVDMNAGTIRTFPAKVAATKQVDLAFRLPGHLIEFALVEGQQVKQGEILARLDDRDARNTLLNSEANHDLAAADFKRKGKLLRSQLISQADYDLSQAQLKSAQASLASASDQLSYTVLKAPYNGTVAKIDIDNYQMVQANQPILVLQQDRNIDVVIQVSESLATSVTQFDHDATVRFSAQPDKFYPVQLKEYATQVTQGTQSYEVVFTLPQPSDSNILPGMSAELTIDVADAKQPITSTVLPASAIAKRDADGQDIIWLYNTENGTVNPHPVTLGKVRTNGIEVISGINTGDQVVVAGIQYLSAGLAVKPLRWQRGV